MEEKEEKETKKQTQAAKLIVKRAKSTEELHTQILYGAVEKLVDKSQFSIRRDIISYLWPVEKDFLLDGIWKLEIADYPGWGKAAIWLDVKSENCAVKIELAKDIQVLLDILTKFENSWEEKVEFILVALGKINGTIKRGVRPLWIAKILAEICEKIEAQYETEEKLETSQTENRELIRQLDNCICFLGEVSTELEGTKRHFKSKKIAEIREGIKEKIVNILNSLRNVDPTLVDRVGSLSLYKHNKTEATKERFRLGFNEKDGTFSCHPVD